jgi:hypothetical protein
MQIRLFIVAERQITDRCWKRALAANPASEQPGNSETAARGSGSVHLLVRCGTEWLLLAHVSCKHALVQSA